MIRALLVILLFACPIDSQSQDQAAKTFIQNYFGVGAKLVFQDRLDSYQIDGMRNALNKDTLYGLNGIRNDYNKVLVLSTQERLYINRALSELAVHQWSSDLFRYGNRILKDSVAAIFKDRRRGWPYFRQYYGAKLYEFSNPIFIRDDTLSIFYSGYSCDSECGEGSLVILKREKDGWSRWMMLYAWMS